MENVPLFVLCVCYVCIPLICRVTTATSRFLLRDIQIQVSRSRQFFFYHLFSSNQFIFNLNLKSLNCFDCFLLHLFWKAYRAFILKPEVRQTQSEWPKMKCAACSLITPDDWIKRTGTVKVLLIVVGVSGVESRGGVFKENRGFRRTEVVPVDVTSRRANHETRQHNFIQSALTVCS